MARNRLNPWPSFSDLFSALLVASIVSLAVVQAGVEESIQFTQAERKSKEFTSQLAKRISSAGREVTVHECPYGGLDTCIEIAFRFEVNRAELSEQGKREVAATCQVYKSALSELLTDRRFQGVIQQKDIELVLEGHSDEQQPSSITNQHQRELFNWRLSSDRANEVRYEFRKCGVLQENSYLVSASGFADTRPLCKEKTQACYEKNRRTTMRIRADLNALNCRLNPKTCGTLLAPAR